MAFGATAANAGITIPAGDWTIDIGGNVNAFYTNTKYDGDLDVLQDDKAQTIQTGLLPSALGVGGKTRQNDLDIAFQFTFFTGADSGNGQAAGSNSLNIRQAYMTFGDASWGTIKMGRDLGIYGSDAILSDMTLLGVGVGAGAGGTSTLGRIGSGYMYADWVGQISYTSPNWNGFSFAVGMREPWSNGDSNAGAQPREDMGFEGKVNYAWAGDVSGKVWASFITQKHDNGYYSDRPSGMYEDFGTVNTDDSYTARGWDIGGKVSMAGFDLTGYYYDGRGLGSALMFLTPYSNKTDDDGYYVQAMYTVPGLGTKIGVSYGESNSESKFHGTDDWDDEPATYREDYENKSWMVGIYHPLTKSLNLVAEYVDNDIQTKYRFSETDGGGRSGKVDGDARTISLGAIMFF